MKKKIKKRGKIVAALITVISFAAALTWYNAKNAYAFGTYDAGGNKHFEEGHVTITINGPDGKSDSLTIVMTTQRTKKLAVKILRISNIHTLYHTILVDMVPIAFRWTDRIIE